MELTAERRKCLEVISASRGVLSHDDPALDPFCDDKSTLTKPDVFNQCHDAGWLISSVDHADNSIVRLTEAGRAQLRQSTDHQNGVEIK